MSTTHCRIITTAVENHYASWREYFVAAFLLATLGLTANAEPLTFNGLNAFSDRSLAVDGNNVLIGAPLDDTLGPNVGKARLFDAATGNLLQTFNDPTPNAGGGDLFGSAVALDGNKVLIGARGDSTLGTEIGQAHLFDATTGDLLWTFNDPTPGPGGVNICDEFGTDVAIDGNNVLIGAPRDNTLGAFVGQAHLFDATTGDLLQTFNYSGTPPSEPSDHTLFGFSVALDGNNVLIAAPGDDTLGGGVGQAYLFDATTGDLLQTFNDPTPTFDGRFGYLTALDGNNVVIGDPFDDTLGNSVGQAYLFDATTGNLLRTFNDPTVTTMDYFGWPVALDGNKVLIGASGDDTLGQDAGQAFLFTFFQADFDGDGDVDGNDFLAWQIGFGTQTGAQKSDGDYDNDGDVDGNDFLDWQNEFGSGDGSASAAVPEPASIALLTILAVMGILSCRLLPGTRRSIRIRWRSPAQGAARHRGSRRRRLGPTGSRYARRGLRPRSEVIRESQVGVYHVSARCVRRANPMEIRRRLESAAGYAFDGGADRCGSRCRALVSGSW